MGTRGQKVTPTKSTRYYIILREISLPISGFELLPGKAIALWNGPSRARSLRYFPFSTCLAASVATFFCLASSTFACF